MAGNTRIRSTHVGSLPRPPALADAHLNRAMGQPIDEAAFERMITEAVADVVRRQVDAGITMVNDGEQGKSAFFGYQLFRLKGFDIRPRPEGAQASVGALGMGGERND